LRGTRPGANRGEGRQHCPADQRSTPKTNESFISSPDIIKPEWYTFSKTEKRNLFFLPSPEAKYAHDLAADDDAVAAGAALDVLVLRLGGGAGVVNEGAAGAAAVEADALALAGDAVALAGARGAVRGGGAVAGLVGVIRAVGEGRADGGDGGSGGTEVGDEVLLVVVDAGGSEAGRELLLVKVVVDDLAGGRGVDGLGGLDLGDGKGAALGDLGAGRLGGGGGLAGRGLGGGGLGDIKDVQGAAGGGLDGGLLRGVVGDVVTIDDVVVPVALAGLESGGLEAEGALPRAGLGGGLVLGERELAGVVVPRAEEMDGLDAGGDTEVE